MALTRWPKGSLDLARTGIEASFRYMDQSLVTVYELGNEPNFYALTFLPAAWSASDCGNEMESWIPSLRNTLTKDSKWMFGAFAGPPNLFENGLTIANLVELGVPLENTSVKYFSTHEYPYDICSSAAKGFDRFMFHNGQGEYYYSMREPVDTEFHPGAYIYPTYYAMLFVADLVGDLTDPTTARLTNLDTDSFVHFATFNCGRMVKLVLLNLESFDGTSPRPFQHLDLGKSLGKNLRVRRLTGPVSTSQTSVEWAGQSVAEDEIIIGRLDVEEVHNGRNRHQDPELNNMTQRAASCTVDVGSYVYTFINRPRTDHIDYVRFSEKDPQTGGPDKAVTGKVGTSGGTPLVVQSGPLSCTKFFNRQDSTTDIRLYFVSNSEIREAKLADVGPGSDLDGGWVVPKGKTDDRFSIMTGLVSSGREVDQTSYLTSGRTAPKDSSEPPAPYVVFQAPGETEVINYARASGTGDSTRWNSGSLPVKLVPR
ncbi:hypothetical protein MBLNU13_g03824t2 [Cladosporium sp. NU13]